jgi:hypothetical protein
MGALIALGAAGSASAGSDDDAVLSPLGMTIADAPNPVRGVDNRFHLAYEIMIVNQGSDEVTLDSVRARSAGRKIGDKLVGPDLNGLLRVNGDLGPAIPPGGSARLFMDVDYKRKKDTPRRLTHTFEMTLDPASGPDRTLEFGGVPTPVGQDRAIRIAAPVRGKGWVAAQGCCNPIYAHRSATLSIDGTIHVPERFAIDFVQIDDQDRLFEGPLDELSSYAYYGARIYSSTAGKVVGIRDGLPEETPGSLPPDVTIQTAGGNYVVVRADRDHYVFYAHLQPGSIRVEKGDTVKAGKVLGKLGNTGNTDGPHLHFHVMDGASPLQSNGLPFVFGRFSGQGHITDPDKLQSGDPVNVDSSTESGSYRNRMPLGDQVVNFGKGK